MQWKTFTTLWADNESRRYAKRERFNREQLYLDYLAHHCDLEDGDLYVGRAKRELAWYNSARPYYRVYPCVIEMAKDIRLDAPVRWGLLPDILLCVNPVDDDNGIVNARSAAKLRDQIGAFNKANKSYKPCLSLPINGSDLPAGKTHGEFDPGFWNDLDEAMEFTQSLLVETPQGSNIPSMLLSITVEGHKAFRATICYNDGKDSDGDKAFMTHNLIFNGDAITIEEIVQEATSGRQKEILKLVSLLYMFSDPSLDLMERIILNKDKGKEVTPKILDRAEKAAGKGWTIGRRLEEMPRKSRPHWGIRWCKPDHEGEIVEGWDGVAPESRQGCVPKLRPIRGANEDFYRKVPTGYKD